MLDVYEFRIAFRSRGVLGRITLHFTSDETNGPDPRYTAGILWFAYVANMWAHMLEAQGQFVTHKFARIRRVNNGGGCWYRINPVLVTNPLVPIPLPFTTSAVMLLFAHLNNRWSKIPIRVPGVWMDGQGNNQVPEVQRARLLLAFSHLFHPWALLGREFLGCVWSRKTHTFQRPLAVEVSPWVTTCRKRRRKPF